MIFKCLCKYMQNNRRERYKADKKNLFKKNFNFDIQNVYEEGELEANRTSRKFRQVERELDEEIRNFRISANKKSTYRTSPVSA